MKQKYICEECGLKSEVAYSEHDDVYTVINLIEKDHIKKSESCENSVNRMRLIDD